MQEIAFCLKIWAGEHMKIHVFGEEVVKDLLLM